MTINFKTNVRTVIRYKGQEYSSVDQLPAEARAAYESALAKGAATATSPGIKQSIVVNGQHFDSMSELPVADRKLLDDAMACVRDNVAASNGPVASSSWVTPAQLRLAALFAGIVVLIVWMLSLAH